MDQTMVAYRRYRVYRGSGLKSDKDKRRSENNKDRAQVTGPAVFDAFTRNAETGRRSYDRRQAITTSLSSVDLGYIPACFRRL